MTPIDLCGVDAESEILIRSAQPLTPDEFFDFCQANECWRIEQNASGEIELLPLRGLTISAMVVAASAQLAEWTKRDGRGRSLLHCGFRLRNGATRSPSISWLSREVYNSLSTADHEKFPRACPEFLIEILSTIDSPSRTDRWMREWTGNGTHLAWLLDPACRSVHIYRPGREPETLRDPATVAGEGPVTGLLLDTWDVWDRA